MTHMLPSHSCAMRNDLDHLRAWVEAGVDLNAPDYDQRRALHIVCIYVIIEYIDYGGISSVLRTLMISCYEHFMFYYRPCHMGTRKQSSSS